MKVTEEKMLQFAKELVEAMQDSKDAQNGECDYCHDQSPHRDCVMDDGEEQILCSRDGLFGDCYIYTRKINFCPMCGRKIDNEQEN